MNREVIFTICAKNYLAQALSLKESTLRHNDIDFYIFLSDDVDSEELPDVVRLDDAWIPNWRNMAFKYDVIEFSTSIKPFCFQKLFKDGYKKVIYLDPDIYVYNSLDVVFSALDSKSAVLTPHRCYITDTSDDMVSEQLVSSVGIYNCGFIAIKNDTVGNQIVNWWAKRLTNHCLCDLSHGLFVDQKWIDFVPGYFPNDVLISNHLGLNVATWNLQEREITDKEGTYFVKSRIDNRQSPLVFFHFSGYNPHKPSLLHKRHDKSDVKYFPEIKNMVVEYREAELKNEYDKYSKMKYSFNFFTDGTPILAIHRRLYYRNLQGLKNINSPFDSNGYLYALYANRGLIKEGQNFSSSHHIPKMKHLDLNQKIAKSLFHLLGIKKYLKLMNKFTTLGSYSYYDFLIEE
jgi:lipopolysaccharide biosynthesis glycosyltransferase